MSDKFKLFVPRPVQSDASLHAAFGEEYCPNCREWKKHSCFTDHLGHKTERCNQCRDDHRKQIAANRSYETYRLKKQRDFKPVEPEHFGQDFCPYCGSWKADASFISRTRDKNIMCFDCSEQRRASVKRQRERSK